MKMLPCSAFLLPLVLTTGRITAAAQPTPSLPQVKTATLVCEESPPYNYEEKGEIVGIASDIIRESFKRAGYGVIFKQFPWARALAMAQGGSVDGIFCLYKTSEREKAFVFSRRFASDTQSFFVLSEAKITFNGHLQGMGAYTIGTVRGYSYGERFDRAVKSGVLGKTEPVSNVDQNIQKLLSKRIDAFIEGSTWGWPN